MTHEVINTKRDKTVVELASGSFEEDQVSLVVEIDTTTNAKISISNSQGIALSLNVLNVPGSSVIHFALLDDRASHLNEAVLVGVSRRTKDQNSKFSISGTYEPQRENCDNEGTKIIRSADM